MQYTHYKGESMARKRKTAYGAKNCLFCQKQFIPKTAWQKYCRIECHNGHWKGKRSPLDSRVDALEARVAALEAAGIRKA
jgi:hypothetical protein